MRWTPQHNRWLAACLLMLLLSVWAGGLSFSVVAVFAVIFATGAALLSSGFPAPPVPEWTSAEDDIPTEDADIPTEDSPAEDAQPVSD